MYRLAALAVAPIFVGNDNKKNGVRAMTSLFNLLVEMAEGLLWTHRSGRQPTIAEPVGPPFRFRVPRPATSHRTPCETKSEPSAAARVPDVDAQTPSATAPLPDLAQTASARRARAA
jgi:hypothetical protein